VLGKRRRGTPPPHHPRVSVPVYVRALYAYGLRRATEWMRFSCDVGVFVPVYVRALYAYALWRATEWMCFFAPVYLVLGFTSFWDGMDAFLVRCRGFRVCVHSNVCVV
jgi:hypothetical protein